MKFLKQDELIGGWFNNAEDGSGLNGIWGYGLNFQPKGEGVWRNWGIEDEDTLGNQPFEWLRLSKNVIKIKFISAEDWEQINYEISNFVGAYDVKYKKLVKCGTNEFWCSPEPLYKKS